MPDNGKTTYFHSLQDHHLKTTYFHSLQDHHHQLGAKITTEFQHYHNYKTHINFNNG